MLTFSGLGSREGISSFFTRLFMTAFYDLERIYDAYKDAESDFGRAEQVAKALALVFNFKIE